MRRWSCTPVRSPAGCVDWLTPPGPLFRGIARRASSPSSIGVCRRPEECNGQLASAPVHAGLLVRHRHGCVLPAVLGRPVHLPDDRGPQRGRAARPAVHLVGLLPAVPAVDLRELAVGVPSAHLAGGRAGPLLLLGVLAVQGGRRPDRGQGRRAAARAWHRPGGAQRPDGAGGLALTLLSQDGGAGGRNARPAPAAPPASSVSPTERSAAIAAPIGPGPKLTLATPRASNATTDGPSARPKALTGAAMRATTSSSTTGSVIRIG